MTDEKFKAAKEIEAKIAKLLSHRKEVTDICYRGGKPDFDQFNIKVSGGNESAVLSKMFMLVEPAKHIQLYVDEINRQIEIFENEFKNL